MTRAEMLENYPLQILSYGDLVKITGRAQKDLEKRIPSDELPPEVRARWESLIGRVRAALQDARLYGQNTPKDWETEITTTLAELEASLDEETARRVRARYMDYLDTLYGAILHHIMHNLPTDIVAPQGHLGVYRIGVWRYAMVRNTPEKSALRQVLEMMYHGGAHLELEFDWKVLGAR